MGTTVYSLLQVKRDGRSGSGRKYAVNVRGPRLVFRCQSAEEFPRNVAVGDHRIRVNCRGFGIFGTDHARARI